MTQIDRVIAVAKGELGDTENPAGSNRTKYGAAYGVDGWPWCVIFLWWCFREAGLSQLFFGGARTASCGTLLRWHREQGQTVQVSEVRPGDIVILNFHGTQDTEHCGLVVDADGTYVATIEGNTSPGLEGSQDNGGCVAWKRRLLSQIVGVCRPQYKADDPQPMDDVEGHWAKRSIRWAEELGLVKGYPDGTFQPDKTVTRAEACVMLERLYNLLLDSDMR